MEESTEPDPLASAEGDATQNQEEIEVSAIPLPEETGKTEGKKTKSRKAKQQPRDSRSLRRSPYGESSADIRSRKNYELRTSGNFCPRTGYKMYIYQIDELLRLEDEFTFIRDKIHNMVSRIYRHYGLEPPLSSSSQVSRQQKYIQVVKSYLEIKRLLQAPGSKDNPSFEDWLASLEICGAIILNPSLMGWVNFNYSDEEMKYPYLETHMFTTRWTADRIEKISWGPDMETIFHKVKRDRLMFRYEGE